MGAPGRPQAPAPADDLARHARIQALVAMLVSDRLSEEEFELRWNLALEATTAAQLDVLGYESDVADDDDGRAVERAARDHS